MCLSSNRDTQEGVQGKGESSKHQDKETDVNICRIRLFLLTTIRTKFQDHDSIGHIILKKKITEVTAQRKKQRWGNSGDH